MALKRTSRRGGGRTLGGGGTTTYASSGAAPAAPSGGTSSSGRSGGGTSSSARTSTSSRQSIEDYTARLEASHRLQVERSLITNDNALSRARSTSELSMSRWLAQQSVLLTDRRDKEALERIGKGDAAYGMSYAARRAKEARASGNDDDATYWDDIADRAAEKAEDDYISGQVTAGIFEPADILPVLRERQARQNPGSPGYMALSKQIGEVGLAVKAEKFNRAIASAYSKFTESGDRKGYMTDLLTLFAGAKEQTLRTQLQSKIVGLQKEIDTEGEAERKKAVTEKVLAYYADRGENPASGVLFFLADAVKNAKTPQEAQGLIALAQSITTRERTLQQDAMRGAGGSGGSGGSRGGSSSGGSRSSSGGSGTTATKTAVDAELADERADLKAAAMHLKERVLDNKHIPSDAEWAIFWAAGDKAQQGLTTAIEAGGLTVSATKTLTNELLALGKQRDDYKIAAAVNVTAESESLQGKIADLITAKKAAGEGLSGAAEAIGPLLAKLRALSGSVYLQGDKGHTESVVKNITQATTPFSNELAKDTKQLLAWEEAPTGPLMDKYMSFRQSYLNLNGSNPKVPAEPPPFQTWFKLMNDTALSEEARAIALGMWKPASGTTLGDAASGAGAGDADAIQRIAKAFGDQYDATLKTARRASAVVAGHQFDARDLWDVREIVSGMPDMEARRAQRLSGLITPEELAAIEASSQPPAPAAREASGGNKSVQLGMSGGILGGADQHRSPDDLFLDTMFRDYGEDARDQRLGAPTGEALPLEDEAYQLDSGERARNKRTGLESWQFGDNESPQEYDGSEQARDFRLGIIDYSQTDTDSMWGNTGFLDESERTYRRVQGTPAAQAASDFLDSTTPLDIGGWTLPDDPDESPMLDDNLNADSWNFDLPPELPTNEYGEDARDLRLSGNDTSEEVREFERDKRLATPEPEVNTSPSEGTYLTE